MGGGLWQKKIAKGQLGLFGEFCNQFGVDLAGCLPMFDFFNGSSNFARQFGWAQGRCGPSPNESAST